MRLTIESEREKFQKFLTNSGLRLTAGREIVFNEVMESHGHFAAEELAKRCSTKRLRVSRATVYRSLKELLEAGVIRETAYGVKHQLFEHIYDEQPHHHARCIKCNAVIEIPDSGEEKKYQPILQKQGFQIVGHELHFYGICKTCSG